jgi:hypothetical protein
MTDVKDNTVPFGNWSLVEGVWPHQLEKMIRVGASLMNPPNECLTKLDLSVSSQHFHLRLHFLLLRVAPKSLRGKMPGLLKRLSFPEVFD